MFSEMKEFAKELHNHFDDLMPEFKPDIIYHYTTVSVLPEFMKDDADFYCTHCQALNDDDEFVLGLEYVESFISREYEVHSTAFVDKFYRLYEDKWRQPWIMSFTTKKDSLVQWIAYSDKKEGGYAVGFNYKALRNLVHENLIASSESFNVYLLPCLYLHHKVGESVEIDARADELLSYLLKPLSTELGEFVRRKTFSGGSGDIESAVFLFASMVKNASFRYESECRLVIQPMTRESALSNYKVVGGKPRLPSTLFHNSGQLRSMIKSIGISPHGKHNILLDIADLYKAKYGKGIKVYNSSSPYNGQ